MTEAEIFAEAMGSEKHAIRDYGEYAQKTPDPKDAKLFKEIQGEEKHHFEELSGRAQKKGMTECDIDELAHLVVDGLIGEGAIPLYGRETKKEPCKCCKTDDKLMCTTSDAIGMLSQQEVKDWCSEIIEVPDGRCDRVKKIREAAKECKEKHPSDTRAFAECYFPTFGRITKESNPRGNPLLATEGSKVKLFKTIARAKTAYGSRLEDIELPITSLRDIEPDEVGFTWISKIPHLPKELSDRYRLIHIPHISEREKLLGEGSNPGKEPFEPTKMPRINPHATAIQQDKQAIEQIKWLKAHGFKTARDAQEAGY